jgi:hypothetical protein
VDSFTLEIIKFMYDLSDNNFLIQLSIIVIIIFGLGWWLYSSGKGKDSKNDVPNQLSFWSSLCTRRVSLSFDTVLSAITEGVNKESNKTFYRRKNYFSLWINLHI